MQPGQITSLWCDQVLAKHIDICENYADICKANFIFFHLWYFSFSVDLAFPEIQSCLTYALGNACLYGKLSLPQLHQHFGQIPLFRQKSIIFMECRHVALLQNLMTGCPQVAKHKLHLVNFKWLVYKYSLLEETLLVQV